MLLEKINNFARKLDNRVVQVSISLTGSYSHIQILKKIMKIMRFKTFSKIECSNCC